MTRRIEFIVEADEPALFFESKSDAEMSLESWDVEEGVYPIAFDRSGIVYHVVPYKNRASLIPDPSLKKDPARLRKTLAAFLAASNIAFTPSDSLNDLIAKCERFLEFR